MLIMFQTSIMNKTRLMIFMVLLMMVTFGLMTQFGRPPFYNSFHMKIHEGLVKQSFEVPSVAFSEPLAPLSYLHASSVSKDLVVYGAFFDDRPRKKHTNITMIFIEAKKIIFNSKRITGCGVGSTIASNFIVRYIQEDILMHKIRSLKKLPYEQLAVECYDLPVINGTRAFVMYNTSNLQTIVVESERPVMIPAPRIKPSGKHNFSVVVCTKAHTRRVTWLPEFLRYQKILGVDHVHLTILDEFIKDGGYRDLLLTDPSFIKAVNEDFITIQVWKEWYENSETSNHATILMYLDCIYHYRGTYDYVSLMDSDDFFISLDPNKEYKNIIHEYCFKKRAGSCSFTWLAFSPGVCGMKDKVGDDGNVTAHLVPHHAKLSHRFKSVHSTAAIVDTSYHDATCDGCLLSGYTVVRVPPHVAYVAHNRMYRMYTKETKQKRCHI